MATGRQRELNRNNSGDFIEELTVSHSCEPCMKSNESKTATIFCQTCDEYICDACKNPHNVYKPGKHDMVRIQDKKSVRVVQALKSMDIGQVHVETSPVRLLSKPTPVTLEQLVSVDIIPTGDDKNQPFLDGLDFLPDGRLVAVDSLNSKCIIMDDRLQIHGTPYKLHSVPHDVVCLSQGELAVTMIDKTVCLLSMNPGKVIRLTKKINTSTNVDSICCMTPTNMVISTFNHSRPVRMITQTGVESDFDHVLFPNKTYKRNESKCTYVPSKNTLVLTDRSANTVYLYDTFKGTSRAVTDDNIRRPRSACAGPGDTVLVCSEATNSIVHLTVEGDILGTYPVDMQLPWALCMNKDGTRLAVSNSNKNIQLFKISPVMS